MAAGLPRIQFQTLLIHFANRNLFFNSSHYCILVDSPPVHFRSHPQSTAAAAGRQRRPQWAEPLRWRFLVSPATVPPQLMTPFHVFSSDAARIIFSDTKGSFVCSCTITRLFLPHPSPACFRARPNECAFLETADSEYTIYRSISVEKVLF